MTGCIYVNSEPWVHRLITHSKTGREDAFRNRIRARDGRYVVTGIVNLSADSEDWSSFEAAHIFPLESESYWIHQGYGQWITDMNNTTGSKINPLQNGILLLSHVHQTFDQYLLSINPGVLKPNSLSLLFMMLTYSRVATSLWFSKKIYLAWTDKHLILFAATLQIHIACLTNFLDDISVSR